MAVVQLVAQPFHQHPPLLTVPVLHKLVQSLCLS